MSSSNDTIVVVGSCMIDFVCYAPRLPNEGETIHGSKFVTNFGGKGANQCVAAAKLGGKTSMVARVGGDQWGDKYVENFKTLGVDTTYVSKTPGYANGIAQITVSDLGANQIVIVAGANTQLSTDDVTKAQDLVRNAAVLVCQLETSLGVAMKSLELCRGISILNGAPAIFDAPEKLFTLPTIFCVNESEAEVFSGVPVKSVKDAEKATSVLISKGCQSVIITLGSAGAVYTTKQDPSKVHHIHTPKVKSVDSTGAGDAFIGALAFILATKKQLDTLEAIKIACAIAADSVTRPGTQPSFPGPEILKSLIK